VREYKWQISSIAVHYFRNSYICIKNPVNYISEEKTPD
jgi:hypothetical protein